MAKAIIFDADGVVIDSLPPNIEVWKKIFERHGLRFLIDIKEASGRSTEDIARIALKNNGIDDPLLLEQIVREKKEMDPWVIENTGLVDGIRELLEYLKNKDYAIALASSGRRERIIPTLIRQGIEKYFDILVFIDEVQHPKPEPDLFLLASYKLGVSPEQCIVIEDSIHGVIAARKAGMKPVALANSIPREDFRIVGGVIIVDSLQEVVYFLEQGVL